MKRPRSTTAAICALLATLGAPAAAGPCPNQCSGHGHCSTQDRVCDCLDGFKGADCSLMMCPLGPAWSDVATAEDDAHNMAECSNRGTCDRTTGLCGCQDGLYSGSACERKNCPNDCGQRGRCVSLAYHASTKDEGEGTVHEYETPWDAHMIYGCECDAPFFGAACEQVGCPKGDDPLTGTGADGDAMQFFEEQLLSCTAVGGTFTLSFRKETTTPIPYDASVSDVRAALEALPTIDNRYAQAISVTYSPSDYACSMNGNEITIKFMQDFGDVPFLVADKSLLTPANAFGEAQLSVASIRQGTKEDVYCSNRGVCDFLTGECTCDVLYETSNGLGSAGQRGDCGAAKSTITQCPGETSCSGHGVCQSEPTYVCNCQPPYTGTDCSQYSCALGKSWFDYPSADNSGHTVYAECSDMGTCDATSGACECSPGFSGSACQYMSCPGDPACSGNGECYPMSMLAEMATVNGDAADWKYAAAPNNPLTWDGERILGCFCDDNFFGYDCSLMSCPAGDDPITYVGQFNEIQEFTCQATSDDDATGSFSLTFRQQETAQIDARSSPADVEAALEALSGINDVKVTSTDSSYVCGSASNVFYVEFLSPTGDVPLIQITTDDIGTLDVSEFQRGSKEYIECSGRGLCDYTTGICACSDGYGGSDGQGNSGTRADCGYMEPIMLPEA